MDKLDDEASVFKTFSSPFQQEQEQEDECVCTCVCLCMHPHKFLTAFLFSICSSSSSSVNCWLSACSLREKHTDRHRPCFLLHLLWLWNTQRWAPLEGKTPTRGCTDHCALPSPGPQSPIVGSVGSGCPSKLGTSTTGPSETSSAIRRGSRKKSCCDLS